MNTNTNVSKTDAAKISKEMLDQLAEWDRQSRECTGMIRVKASRKAKAFRAKFAL